MQTSWEKMELQLTGWQNVCWFFWTRAGFIVTGQIAKQHLVDRCMAEESGASVLKGGVEHVMSVLQGPSGDHQAGPEL